MAARQLEALTPDESRDLLSEHAVLFGNISNLLGSNFVIQGLHGPETLEITEVEGFSSLVPGSSFEREFDSKPRTAGELWISSHRGSIIVNVVVDPEKKQVIALKAVKKDGKTTSVQKAVSESLGFPRANFTDNPTFIRTVQTALDGEQTFTNDNTAKARIAGLADETVVRIQKVVGEYPDHSIGRFAVEK